MRLITWIHPRGSGTLLVLSRHPFEDDIQAFPSLPTKTSNFQFYWNEKFSIKGGGCYRKLEDYGRKFLNFLWVIFFAVIQFNGTIPHFIITLVCNSSRSIVLIFF